LFDVMIEKGCHVDDRIWISIIAGFFRLVIWYFTEA
jgi:hypothetical protein